MSEQVGRGRGEGGERKRGKGIRVAGTPNIIGFELPTRCIHALGVENLLFFRPICRPGQTDAGAVCEALELLLRGVGHKIPRVEPSPARECALDDVNKARGNAIAQIGLNRDITVKPLTFLKGQDREGA